VARATICSGLSCAAGRRPVRQRVVGDNQMQWSASTMGAGGRPGLGLELLDRVDNVVFYWQRRRRGGKRTYSYSTAPHSDKWEKVV